MPVTLHDFPGSFDKKILTFRKLYFMATRRTTHRSVAGKKLYTVRDAKGRFVDIQTYERAHRQDIKRKSKAEQTRKK
jgi:hypothetical protein